MTSCRSYEIQMASKSLLPAALHRKPNSNPGHKFSGSLEPGAWDRGLEQGFLGLTLLVRIPGPSGQALTGFYRVFLRAILLGRTQGLC